MKRVEKWTYLNPEEPYITFLGSGCRLKSSIRPCDLMLRAPSHQLEKIHTHISDMTKPITMFNKEK